MIKNNQKKSFKKAAPRRFAVGETLLEVILALFVVAVGSGAATTLIISSLQANTFSRDNLVALNLAVEGLEAMRNIRDTNWLKFGYDKSNCWDVQPGLAVGSDCTAAASKIDDGYYTIDLDPNNYSWGLTQVGTAAIESLALADVSHVKNYNYILGFVDLNNVDGTDGKDLFVTAGTAVDAPITYTDESKFYRMIQITYNPVPLGEDVESMDVVSTVQWDQNGVHTVRLATTLANYEKVPL